MGGAYYNLHDMAWRDSDGYCFFVGRNDDVIKCSGYRIGPFEVESALVEHPAVVECAVTAAPDPIRGKVVKATVVLAKGCEPSDELVKELQNHVKKTTAPYKYPRIVEFADELPEDHRRQDQAQAHPHERRHRGLTRGACGRPSALSGQRVPRAGPLRVSGVR